MPTRGIPARSWPRRPGSYLAISHGASDTQAQDVSTASSRNNGHSAVAMRLWTRAEVTRFFDGLELTAPGVVPSNQCNWIPISLLTYGRRQPPEAGC